MAKTQPPFIWTLYPQSLRTTKLCKKRDVINTPKYGPRAAIQKRKGPKQTENSGVSHSKSLKEEPLDPNLDVLEHSGSKGGARVVITGRVIGSLGDGDVLDHTIDDVHSETLAAADDTDGGRAGVDHLDVESLGKLSGGVAHHVDEGTSDSLVLSPSLHDGGIWHDEEVVWGEQVVSCQIDDFTGEKDIGAILCLLLILGLTIDAVHKYLVDSLRLESCLLERR